uniref:Uncharacterized protein n=1 Tax=Meloidogyne enterolobii TaxID=390850 RepID=A0A6V7X9H8_MELEN|nr:unnamed protein product [Meloidogyne enterolobii]
MNASQLMKDYLMAMIVCVVRFDVFEVLLVLPCSKKDPSFAYGSSLKLP